MYKIACRLLNVSVLLLAVSHCTAQDAVISSPDKKITVVVERSGSATGYRVLREGAEVIHFSKLGLHSMEADLVTGLVYKSAGPSTLTKGNYRLYTGKQRSVNYVANRRTIVFNAGNTHQLEVEFHVANDGLAFRYKVHGKGVTGVTGEATSFALDTSARAFLQPMQVAKTGFEQTNPAYEDNYLQDLPAGAASPSAAGWVYPALFRSGSQWLLFTEAGMDGTYCATHLMNDSARSEYQVVFPDPREVIG
ncbi:MAG: glycoside hydrolase family 97 protein, partial [Chitinophagaceae bacterium]